MSGKGSRYRPVNKKKFDQGWDRIFGNKKQDPEIKEEKQTTNKLKVNYD